MKILIFSIDVEPDYYKDKTKLSYNHIKNNLIPFLDYLVKKNIKITLFITPEVLKEKWNLFKKYINFHEFGCHVHPELDKNYYNKNKIPLIDLNRKEQRRLIYNSFSIIKKFTSKNPISFRASSHKINEDTFFVLNDLGFRVDSSILYNNTLAHPYKKGNLWEFPVTISYDFPYFIKPMILIRNMFLKKKTGIDFTGHKLKSSWFFGLISGGYLVEYAIKKMFVKYDILNMYVHSYDLRETNLLDSFKKIISKHNKSYKILSFQSVLENDSFSKNK